MDAFFLIKRTKEIEDFLLVLLLLAVARIEDGCCTPFLAGWH